MNLEKAMKVFIVIVVLTCCLATDSTTKLNFGRFHHHTTTEEPIEPEVNKIYEFFDHRCKIFSKQQVKSDNFMIHLDRLLSYSEYGYNLVINDREQFCFEEKPKLSGNMKQVLAEMEECLGKQEEWLPSFLQKSFDGFLVFLCEKNYKNIDDYFGVEGLDCRARLYELDALTLFGHCFNTTSMREGMKKKEFCKDLDEAKICFDEIIDETCNYLEPFHIMNKKFFAAITKPCAGCMLTSNTLLFIVLAGFVLKIFY